MKKERERNKKIKKKEAEGRKGGREKTKAFDWGAE